MTEHPSRRSTEVADITEAPTPLQVVRRLSVRHVTVYRYSQPVRIEEHRIMFRPRESHDCSIISTDMEIEPAPRGIRWIRDVFDNSVAVVEFDNSASELRFDVRFTVDHVEALLPHYELDAGARAYPFAYDASEGPDLTLAKARDEPSDAVEAWAFDQVGSVLGPVETMSLLVAITGSIQSSFAYETRPERGVQTPATTLLRRRGSCRDLAFFMMDAVRALGFAARYVSGYIFTRFPTGQRSIHGGNTHAWLQVYLPGAGWVDFDPTNRIVGNRDLIHVGVAWHPRNAMPLWGTWFGASGAYLGMEVMVGVTDETSDNRER